MSSRYIDADALERIILKRVYAVFCGLSFEIDDILADIGSAPSIDIVFCENCRECVEKGVGVDCPSGYGYLYCRRKKSVVDETDYCSWGIEK